MEGLKGLLQASDCKNEVRFPERAAWLKERLYERGWNKHHVGQHRGPDKKTVHRILDGYKVREDVLGNLATALSDAPASKGLPNVTIGDIPNR